MGERGEGDLEYADLGEALFEYVNVCYLAVHGLRDLHLSIYFGEKGKLSKKKSLLIENPVGLQHA